MINGTAYAWANIRTQLLGQTVTGITAISYGHKQDKANNYGAGTNPVSRSIGKREPNASNSLILKVMKRIQAAVPLGAASSTSSPSPL